MTDLKGVTASATYSVRKVLDQYEYEELSMTMEGSAEYKGSAEALLLEAQRICRLNTAKSQAARRAKEKADPAAGTIKEISTINKTQV